MDLDSLWRIHQGDLFSSSLSLCGKRNLLQKHVVYCFMLIGCFQPADFLKVSQRNETKVDYERKILKVKEVGDSDEDVHNCTVFRLKECEMTRNYANLQTIA